MKRTSSILFLLLISVVLFESCSKSSNSVSNGPLYPVTATILNPAGNPQAGAIFKLQGKADNDSVFAAVTDTTGKATIKAPAGNQTFVAKLGAIFQVTFTASVSASQTGTNIGNHQVVRNTALKVLVVQASAEATEDVLKVLNFGGYDSIYVSDLINNIATDSVKAQSYLAGYTLVFSDCDGGSEGGDDYAQLSREYGRYITNGGKVFGGHYNYYHLQRIFPGYYQNYDDQYPNGSVDSIHIIDPNLNAYVGGAILNWVSADSRNLSGYEKFTDLPPSAVAKTYAYIQGTSPIIYCIVENSLGAGTYVWTDYHNQDVINAYPAADPRLAKIVQYFLYK
ncbi:MAG TPA: hypothetical protein VLX91_12020 [Candidatus Acidoferrales bacterium]|nr:hypothetical protein [Candidatus Acidoferrales bacterium]